jgi:hypothetical protein
VLVNWPTRLAAQNLDSESRLTFVWDWQPGPLFEIFLGWAHYHVVDITPSRGVDSILLLLLSAQLTFSPAGYLLLTLAFAYLCTDRNRELESRGRFEVGLYLHRYNF